MDGPTSSHLHAEPRWHRRKDARPVEILDAAQEEFTTRGFAATRLEDIARRAGCTKGTIFLYFPSKEELFKAVVRNSVIPFIESTETLVAEHAGSSAELLETILRARWNRIVNSKLSMLPKLVFGEAGNFPDLSRFYHEEVVTRSQALLARVLRRGVERGEFADIDVESVALLASAPMLVASLWKHSFCAHVQTNIDIDRYFEAWLQTLLRGIARGAEGGSQA